MGWRAAAVLAIAGVVGLLAWPDPADHPEGARDAIDHAPDEPGRLERPGARPRLAAAPRAADATAKRTHWLQRGTVLGSGAPLEGAVVMAMHATTYVVRIHRTFRDGRYELSLPIAGHWYLSAWHPDHMPSGMPELLDDPKNHAPVTLEVPEGVDTLPARDLVLHAGQRIAGQVVDDRGKPVQGAKIILEMKETMHAIERALDVRLGNWQRHIPLRSDVQGHFSVSCIPPGVDKVRVRAQRIGLYGPWVDVSLRPDAAPEALEIVLSRLATLRGTATHHDGTPVANEAVSLSLPRVPRRVFDPPEVHTDDLGRFELRVPPVEVRMWTYWRDPADAGPTAKVRDLKPAEHRTVDLMLPKRFVLTAHLRTTAGEALSLERLAVTPAGTGTPHNDADCLAREWTDEQGAVQFSLPSDDPLDVMWFGFDGTEVLARDVALPSPPLVLTGRPSPWTDLVVAAFDSDGRPIPRFDSTVWSLQGDAERNEDLFDSNEYDKRERATHRVRGGPPFVVRVADAKTSSGNALDLCRAHQRIEALPPDGIVRITLAQAGLLSGQFVDAKGRGVAGCRLRAKDADGPILEVTADDDGRYAHRVPEHVQAVWLMVDVPADFVAVAGFLYRRYRPGPKAIRLMDGGGFVGGHVRLPKDARLDDNEAVWATWDRKDSDVEQTATFVTTSVNHDGSFQLRNVPGDRPVTVGVQPRAARRQGLVPPQNRQVRAGATDVVFDLKKGLRIKGHVVRADRGNTLCQFHLLPKDHDRLPCVHHGDERGNFEFVGLAPGAYRLRVAQYHPWTVLTELTVRAGDEKVVVQVDGRRGALDVQLEPDVDSFDVTLRRADTHVVVASEWFEGTTGAFDALTVGERFDVVVRAESLVGFQSGVATGSTASVHLAPGVRLRGTVLGEVPRRAEFVARAPGRCFRIPWLSGTFETLVAAGTYDILLVWDTGQMQVVARGVTAPGEVTIDVR